jgi:hypothetical protein
MTQGINLALTAASDLELQAVHEKLNTYPGYRSGLVVDYYFFTVKNMQKTLDLFVSSL